MNIDAVKTVRKIRETHYNHTSLMNKEERLLYYKTKGKEAQHAFEIRAKKMQTNNVA